MTQRIYIGNLPWTVNASIRALLIAANRDGDDYLTLDEYNQYLEREHIPKDDYLTENSFPWMMLQRYTRPGELSPRLFFGGRLFFSDLSAIALQQEWLLPGRLASPIIRGAISLTFGLPSSAINNNYVPMAKRHYWGGFAVETLADIAASALVQRGLVSGAAIFARNPIAGVMIIGASLTVVPAVTHRMVVGIAEEIHYLIEGPEVAPPVLTQDPTFTENDRAL